MAKLKLVFLKNKESIIHKIIEKGTADIKVEKELKDSTSVTITTMGGKKMSYADAKREFEEIQIVKDSGKAESVYTK